MSLSYLNSYENDSVLVFLNLSFKFSTYFGSNPISRVLPFVLMVRSLQQYSMLKPSLCHWTPSPYKCLFQEYTNGYIPYEQRLSSFIRFNMFSLTTVPFLILKQLKQNHCVSELSELVSSYKYRLYSIRLIGSIFL